MMAIYREGQTKIRADGQFRFEGEKKKNGGFRYSGTRDVHDIPRKRTGTASLNACTNGPERRYA